MMKKIFTLLLLFTITVASVVAQDSRQEQRIYSVYFGWNKWTVNTDSQKTELSKAVAELSANPTTTVSIVGWADKTGTQKANSSMSLRRAESVKAYLIANGISDDRITVRGDGVDRSSSDNSKARRADVTLTFYVKEEPKPQPKPETKPEPKPEVKPTPTPQPQQEPKPELVSLNPEPQDNGKFSLRTNLLYWLAATPNLGIEWKPIKALGILVNGGYAPWASNSWKHNFGGWFVAPEIRVYLGAQKRWFVGGIFTYSDYNVKLGYSGYQGTLMAGGLTVGYKLPLSRCFDMDFSLGGGYGERKYDSYYRSANDYNVYIDKKVKKTGFMPLQAGVSLIWKIN